MAQEGFMYKLANLRREVIIGIWLIGICLMAVYPIVTTPKISDIVRNFAKTVEYVSTLRPGGAHVVVEGPLGGGKGTYLQQMARSITRIFFKYGFKFYLMPGSDSSAGYQDTIMKELIAEGEYKLVYGENWMIFPYLSITPQMVDVFCTDTKSLYSVDWYGNPIDSLPMMKDFRTSADMDLHIIQTGGCTWGETLGRTWWKYKLYELTSCSSSCTTNLLVYQTSEPTRGKPSGHLDGVFGAYELDTLMGFKSGAKIIVAGEQWEMLYTAVLIPVGTIAFVMSRRKRAP